MLSLFNFIYRFVLFFSGWIFAIYFTSLPAVLGPYISEWKWNRSRVGEGRLYGTGRLYNIKCFFCVCVFKLVFGYVRVKECPNGLEIWRRIKAPRRVARNRKKTHMKIREKETRDVVKSTSYLSYFSIYLSIFINFTFFSNHQFNIFLYSFLSIYFSIGFLCQRFL